MIEIFEKDNLGRTFVEFIFVNSGAIYQKESVAYVATHMLNTKGTKDKKSKFYSILEEDAIFITFFVNREYFSINLKFLNSKSAKALKELKKILLNPNFTQDALDISKKELKAKIKAKENNFDYVASRNLFKSIFKDTPLENGVEGDAIDEVTLDDVEEFLRGLSKSSLIVINGGKKVKVDSIVDLFSDRKKAEDKFFEAKLNDIKEFKPTQQSYIYFANNFNVPKEKLYLAKVATFILGSGGFGSRVMEEIRVKRGFAYSAYVHNSFQKSFKLLSGHMQTKLENSDEAIKVLKELIDEFVDKGVTQDELDSAKKFLIGSEPLKNETLYLRLARRFNEIYMGLGEGYYKKELELIRDISLDELNRFISTNYPTNFAFSIVTNENI